MNLTNFTFDPSTLGQVVEPQTCEVLMNKATNVLGWRARIISIVMLILFFVIFELYEKEIKNPKGSKIRTKLLIYFPIIFIALSAFMITFTFFFI